MTFFLGANTPYGFQSFYDELIHLPDARAVYILKGGPGCGKSTLMKRVAEAVTAQLDTPVEYTACSSDPDSLDAVCFPRLGVAIVDGTAPHVVEPTAPYVIERYVDLGECYDVGGLAPHREAIIEAIAAGKVCHERAVRCLRAVDSLEDELFTSVATAEVVTKIAKRARGIIMRELGRTHGLGGRVTKRFLNGYTPKGLMVQWPTVREGGNRVYVLEDSYGLAPFMLNPIYLAAVQAGHDVVACYSPTDPERLEHLLLPVLGLAFVTATPLTPYDEKPDRRIRLDACLSPEWLRASRLRLRFLQKTRAALVAQAVGALAQAKQCHDVLEALYHPYVDFGRVTQRADAIAEQILAGAQA